MSSGVHWGSKSVAEFHLGRDEALSAKLDRCERKNRGTVDSQDRGEDKAGVLL